MNIFEVSVVYKVKVQAKDEAEAQELARGLVKTQLSKPVQVIVEPSF